MGSKLELEISLSSENNYITPREKINSIINGAEVIINDIKPNGNAVRERLQTIEAEKPPTFKFEWTPPEKYKSLFSTLKKKGKKEPAQIFFSFFIKDESQLLWYTSAKAENCEVLKSQTKGNGGNVVETVEIKCKAFKEVVKK